MSQLDKVFLERYSLPQPHEVSERDREDAMGAYLMMFAALAAALPLPIINLIAALIYYYSNRSKSKFIHFHCLQSLLTQIPTTVLNWILLFWSIKIFFVKTWVLNSYFYSFLGLVIAVNLVYVIFSIIAAIYARKGKLYHFVIFGLFAHHYVFTKVRSIDYDH